MFIPLLLPCSSSWCLFLGPWWPRCLWITCVSASTASVIRWTLRVIQVAMVMMSGGDLWRHCAVVVASRFRRWMAQLRTSSFAAWSATYAVYLGQMWLSQMWGWRSWPLSVLKLDKFLTQFGYFYLHSTWYRLNSNLRYWYFGMPEIGKSKILNLFVINWTKGETIVGSRLSECS